MNNRTALRHSVLAVVFALLTVACMVGDNTAFMESGKHISVDVVLALILGIGAVHQAATI